MVRVVEGLDGTPSTAEVRAAEAVMRDRLGHFKLSKDAYNTHFYELHHDHTLAQKGMLRGATGPAAARV